MEEQVGKFWDRLISHGASSRYPEAQVRLDEVKTSVGIMFRALGGDGGLGLEAVPDSLHHAHRSWLQSLGGSGTKTPWYWRDERALRLPAVLDLFPKAALNRDLFLWLAALAAKEEDATGDWLNRNQNRTKQLLHDFPGLASRYWRLVQAHIAQRPDPAHLPPDAAAGELAIRSALLTPGSVSHLPTGKKPPWPVPLWSHPSPPTKEVLPGTQDDPMSATQPGDSRGQQEKKTRQGQYVEPPKKDGGLLLHRFESIFSWTDFIKVDRPMDEEDDLDAASKVADDFDVLSITRDKTSSAKRLRFDLDLPSEAHDDIPIRGGVLLPEWDFRSQTLRPDHCRLQPMLARDAGQCDLPASLRRPAQQLRAQFEQLRLGRRWLRQQRDGSDVDLDAYIEHQSERISKRGANESRLYRDLRLQERDLSCLLLADLSLSTDSWINDDLRVIDVIRDALFLFAEALSASQDRFAMYGFSSLRREHIRFNEIKPFNTPYDAQVRGRIQAVRPGFYTRMGAAIRHGGVLLSRQPTAKRLLLLLTDGKPNDIDQYEGRYGVEDTRMAVLEAKNLGIEPFCVTIDREAGEYSAHLFGPGGFAQIRRASDLPNKLPQLYYQLTS
jgi:nitric oxide reductase NorD protein